MAATSKKAATAVTWTVGTEPLARGLVGPAPTRCAATGVFEFSDYPEFRPNLSPAEVLRAGSFGGGYFRNIASAETGVASGAGARERRAGPATARRRYKDAWRELPPAWLEGLDVKTQIASTTYRAAANAYGVNSGVKQDKSDAFGLKAWEASGWMHAQDPYGWFQWYCRFFQGRRSDDDDRQLSRWAKCCGLRGRWKSNLIGKVLRDGKSYDDASVSPVVRQTLQHWGYRLTKADFVAGSKRVKTNGAAYPPASLGGSRATRGDAHMWRRYMPRHELAAVMEPPKKKARAPPKDRAAAPKRARK